MNTQELKKVLIKNSYQTHNYYPPVILGVKICPFLYQKYGFYFM